MFGRPSYTLSTRVDGMPCPAKSPAVPEVASSSKPRSTYWRATSATKRLSRSFTDRNTLPPSGSFWPAPHCPLRKASSKVGAIPMTSPVERISGPSRMSTPGKRRNGKTDSLTDTYPERRMDQGSSSLRVLPSITCVARRGRGTPVALETNGAVREARGFTSRMNTIPSLTANWMFIRPTTRSSLARATVWRSISATVSAGSE